MTLSLTKMAVAVGGLAVSLTAGAGIASAAPDLGPIVNSTCNYSQVMSALNAQDPAAAAEFNESPYAPQMLRKFLESSPDKRERMAQQVQAMPEAQQYLGTIAAVAGTCNNY